MLTKKWTVEDFRKMGVTHVRFIDNADCYGMTKGKVYEIVNYGTQCTIAVINNNGVEDYWFAERFEPVMTKSNLTPDEKQIIMEALVASIDILDAKIEFAVGQRNYDVVIELTNKAKETQAIFDKLNGGNE